MFEASSKKNWIHFKFEWMKISRKFKNIQAIRCLARQKPLLNTILMISSMDIQKQLLLITLSLGKEETIPYFMQSCRYPWSLKFYDPLMAFINENMDETSKENLNNKRTESAKTLIDESPLKKLSESLWSPNKLSSQPVD